MHRFISHSTAALAALVITISTLGAAVTVPGPHFAAVVAIPTLA